MSGKQIKLFLVEGTPGALTTAEITNWTGHVLLARRSELAELVKRDEAQRTGAYILLGDDEAAIGNTRCYIGEADIVADRLRYHERDKDFWDRVVIITSKDANLTKAHGRYLESRLISLATRAGRVTRENNTAPTVPAMPEADASDMDHFVSQLQIVLPVLGINAIRVPLPKSSAPGPATATESPIFRLRHNKIGVDAQAQQIDGEFTMLAGSLVVASWHGVGKADSTMKVYASYRAQRCGKPSGEPVGGAVRGDAGPGTRHDLGQGLTRHEPTRGAWRLADRGVRLVVIDLDWNRSRRTRTGRVREQPYSHRNS
jgi:hypothetical protein